MSPSAKRAFLLVLAVLLLAVLACSLTESRQPPSTEVGPAEPVDTEAGPTAEGVEPDLFPAESMTVSGPGGVEASIAPGALSQDAAVEVGEAGQGEPFFAGSPLSAASGEFALDLGGARQVGEILLSIPLEGATKQSAADDAGVYLVWTQPDGGLPSVVGAHVQEDRLIFPAVGAGKYQAFQMISHEALMGLLGLFEPLAVPTYQQRTPAWCSPTAMTDLANYHQGAWPAGDLGANWGESSNYYLAGKAGQPFNTGYFFHWLLGAGGYTVPSDVKQSFSNGNAEVIIWNWKAAIFIGPEWMDGATYANLNFANDLFDAFQAYVESFVWGLNGPRRPVAWGSSLAGHSRIITGSDGTEYFYNDPGSGSLNSSKTWAAYRQEVIDSFSGPKIEVIDTVIFQAEPRAEHYRRGVLWLFPRKDDGFPGSVALVDGESGDYATNWVWDGSNGHEKGYYHDDLRGVLPADPVFGAQFRALDFGDEVEFTFGMVNISEQAYDYSVGVMLLDGNGALAENLGTFDATLGPGGRQDFNPAGRFDLYGLSPGVYTLRFTLMQGPWQQDVKYVQFRVAPSDLLMVNPEAVLLTNAFCRVGPDPVFDDLTAFEAGTELTLLGYNPERTWGKFEKMVNEIRVQCWISLPAVQITGGENAPILPVPPRPMEAAEPVCKPDLDRTACEAAGGTYFVSAASASCLCPE